MKYFFYSFTAILISIGCITTKNPPLIEIEYRFITAAKGLNLRSEPNVQSEAIILIPAGKIVAVKEKSKQPSELINGISGNWLKVKYTWHEGWIFDGYLSQINSLSKNANELQDFSGIWYGDWVCNGKRSYIQIIASGSYHGLLFDGGDDGGCTTSKINGKVTFVDGMICLSDSTVCFYRWENKIVVATPNTPLVENFGNEIVSGFSKR
ncbi:hypothetical protein CH352_18790 [Leptospira hartskeerlii]|uniref:SH3b domain-containing protein n=1 Tax=Leptospira hartskeerlii TaxID=2023177 RepID=A0A2M9X8E1_9LEPT|nr:SH3 domain-containing protein [Leptospira hartskeerlii]PJZ23924.1 hypothetical protein CH357_18700 [Leptospira hartskeerlii]PJZ31932.1 hypothetical protein CH352_18790 [Leptospira hartskeerlii]